MLVTVLARIAAAETSCALVREGKAQVLRQVAAKIDGAFLWNSAEPSASVSCMVGEDNGFPSLRGSKRRRRLDRDLLLGRVAKSMPLEQIRQWQPGVTVRRRRLRPFISA